MVTNVLGQGMKSLRQQNIVHRDLKPGNILIKKHDITAKMMVRHIEGKLGQGQGQGPLVPE